MSEMTAEHSALPNGESFTLRKIDDKMIGGLSDAAFRAAILESILHGDAAPTQNKEEAEPGETMTQAELDKKYPIKYNGVSVDSFPAPQEPLVSRDHPY